MAMKNARNLSFTRVSLTRFVLLLHHSQNRAGGSPNENTEDRTDQDVIQVPREKATRCT